MLCLFCFQQRVAASFFSVVIKWKHPLQKPFFLHCTFNSTVWLSKHLIMILEGNATLLTRSLNISIVRLCIWQPFLQNINRVKWDKRPLQVLMYGIASEWLISCGLSFCSRCFPLNRIEFHFILFFSSVSLTLSMVCSALCSDCCFFLSSSSQSSFPTYTLSSYLMSVGPLFHAQGNHRAPL